MSDDVFEDVLLAAQAGDENAFAQLWRSLNPPVVRYLRTLAPSSASDLASETWVQVIRNLSKFSGGEPAFRAWVFTIARNKVLDAARHDQRRPRTSTDDTALHRLASPDDTAQRAMDNLSTDAALALIASLPRDQAEVIMLRVVAGLDATAVGAHPRQEPRRRQGHGASWAAPPSGARGATSSGAGTSPDRSPVTL